MTFKSHLYRLIAQHQGNMRNFITTITMMRHTHHDNIMRYRQIIVKDT